MDPKKEPEKSVLEEPVLHSMSMNTSSLLTPKLLIGIVIVALLGVGAGFLLSKKGYTPSVTTTPGSVVETSGDKMTIGSTDTKTFNNTAEGVLKEGGIDGEGQYHLVRPGGDSQNVYLTSSVLDLSQFIGKKIKVWGQTQTAKKAGWLMDVGRVEVSK